VITLFLIPCALLLSDDMGKRLVLLRNWYLQPFTPSKREEVHEKRSG